MRQLFILLLAAVSLSQAACKKDNGNHGADNPTTITIHVPWENAVIAPGDPVNIHAIIEAQEPIHGHRVIIRNTASGATLFDVDRHEHGSTVTVSESWTNSVDQTSMLELEVIATIDHDGNTTSKKVTFQAEK